MVWPRSCEEFLQAFAGDYVVWIGEKDGATGVVHEYEYGFCDYCQTEACQSEWKILEEYQLPKWPCFHDILVVYQRIVKKQSKIDYSPI